MVSSLNFLNLYTFLSLDYNIEGDELTDFNIKQNLSRNIRYDPGKLRAAEIFKKYLDYIGNCRL